MLKINYDFHAGGTHMRMVGEAVVVLGLMCGLGLAGDDGTVVELDGLKSKTPGNWKKGDTGNNKFRVYQFTLPHAEKDKEDAELVITHFQGAGGSTEANLKRWKDMFTGADGRAAEDSAKVQEFKVGKVPVTYLDVAGTYTFKNPPFAPNAKTERRENYRLLGVIFDSPNGPYFLKLTGPARTVEANKAGFEKWLKSFQ